jgi:hypothetical protein
LFFVQRWLVPIGFDSKWTQSSLLDEVN